MLRWYGSTTLSTEQHDTLVTALPVVLQDCYTLESQARTDIIGKLEKAHTEEC